MNSYFSHDSNARNSDKLIRLRMKYKSAGYGIYFMILERLRDEPDYMSVKDYNIIAFDLREDASVIKSIVEDFGLFVFTEDGKYFYSEGFLKRMDKKDKINNTRSEIGKKGALKRWGNKHQCDGEEDENNGKNGKSIAIATENDGKSIAIATNFDSNKSKVKESKVKESKRKEKEMRADCAANFFSLPFEDDSLTMKVVCRVVANEKLRESIRNFIKSRYIANDAIDEIRIAILLKDLFALAPDEETRIKIVEHSTGWRKFFPLPPDYSKNANRNQNDKHPPNANKPPSNENERVRKSSELSHEERIAVAKRNGLAFDDNGEIIYESTGT